MHLQRLMYFHAPSIFAYLSDPNESPDIWWTRPETVEVTEKWVKSMTYDLDTVAYVAVDKDDNVQGIITFRRESQKQWAIGFYFKKSARGGLSEVVSKCIEYAEYYFPAGTVLIARPHSENECCKRFCTKLGFKPHSEGFAFSYS